MLGFMVCGRPEVGEGRGVSRNLDCKAAGMVGPAILPLYVMRQVKNNGAAGAGKWSVPANSIFLIV